MDDDRCVDFGFNAAIDSEGIPEFEVRFLFDFRGLSTPVETGRLNAFCERVFFIFGSSGYREGRLLLWSKFRMAW